MPDLGEIFKAIKSGNVSDIVSIVKEFGLEIVDGRLYAKDKKYAAGQAVYFDMIQLIRKIGLNSVYGAVTNAGSIFFDQRLGQSCTLSGRCTTRHMGSTINVESGYDYSLGKSITYGDTDSIYFTIPEEMKVTMTKDAFIKYADQITETVNASFPAFYEKTFNAKKNVKGIIKAGREICAESALFIKKKRYAALIYTDDSNKRYDRDGKKGKLKIMGLEIKRSDCPEWVQDKLTDTLENLLAHKFNEDEIITFIREWRTEFIEKRPWELGTPKRVNKLAYYTKVYNENQKGVTIPGHVRAAINWNRMCDMALDNSSMRILDGQKTIVCTLNHNTFGMATIAYPIDQQFLPEWFKKLNFDMDAMAKANVDNKIKNIFGILGWDLNRLQTNAKVEELFEWE